MGDGFRYVSAIVPPAEPDYQLGSKELTREDYGAVANKALAESMMQNKWIAEAAVLADRVPETPPQIGPGWHFVEGNSGPEVWQRTDGGDWFDLKCPDPFCPTVLCMGHGRLPDGYRYLGPVLDPKDSYRSAWINASQVAVHINSLLTTEIARAEAAEKHRSMMFELKEDYRLRAEAAEENLRRIRHVRWPWPVPVDLDTGVQLAMPKSDYECALRQVREWKQEAFARREDVSWRFRYQCVKLERDNLLRRLIASEQPTPTDIDYNGPTKEVTNEHGRITRETIPDPVHEQFHRSVGDVLAGKVIPAARKQMREALDKAPAAEKTMPERATRLARQDVGIRLP